MANQIDGNDLRKVILDVVHKNVGSMSSAQQGPVLNQIVQAIKGAEKGYNSEAILTLWYDLFRVGYLSWGSDLHNPNPPFFHLTEMGREALKSISRDPYNPDGYLAHLDRRMVPNLIARAYIEEALRSFNAGCFRAAAFLVGGAAEACIITLRDDLIAKCEGKLDKQVLDWRMSRVLDGIKKFLDQRRAEMPRGLRERYDVGFSSLTGQVRLLRNEAGHPQDIHGIEEATAHAALLVFPEAVALIKEISEWLEAGAKG